MLVMLSSVATARGVGEVYARETGEVDRDLCNSDLFVYVACALVAVSSVMRVTLCSADHGGHLVASYRLVISRPFHRAVCAPPRLPMSVPCGRLRFLFGHRLCLPPLLSQLRLHIR